MATATVIRRAAMYLQDAQLGHQVIYDILKGKSNIGKTENASEQFIYNTI